MFFLLFLALTAINCDDNVTNYAIPYSNCLLELQYYNQNQFNLLNCYKFGKKFWSGTDWGDCTYRCCSPVKSYDKVRSSVEDCGPDRDRYQSRMAGIIVGSIFGGLIVIALLVLIGVKIKQKCREMAVIPLPAREVPSQMSIAHIRPNIQWLKLPSKKQSYNCPICLQPKPNLEFSQCKHLAHVECWKEWSKKSKTCVICRDSLLVQMKIYCIKCYQSYYTCRGDWINSIEDSKLTCDDCK